MNKKYKIALFLIALVTFVLLLSSFYFVGNEKGSKETMLGVIMPGAISEVGWNGSHYHGIKNAADILGMQITLKENIKEYSGECKKAVDELIAKGIKIIILVSYNYPDEIKETIKAHPEVQFFCCASNITIQNYKSYFARVYQARYLSGIVAGLETKNNKIGYVAAMNNAEVNRGMNAFVLGVKSVNPEATIFIRWTNSWDDAEKERNNVKFLYDSIGIDLVTYHQNLPNVLEAAEELGIFSIGYNQPEQKYSDKVLTSVITNWTMVYKEFLQDYLQKKNTDQINYWVGMERDAAGLAFYSSRVSENTQKAVTDAIEKIKSGIDVFYGEILDNQGVKRCEKNEVIGDTFLRDNMDWFVNGIEILE